MQQIIIRIASRFRAHQQLLCKRNGFHYAIKITKHFNLGPTGSGRKAQNKGVESRTNPDNVIDKKFLNKIAYVVRATTSKSIYIVVGVLVSSVVGYVYFFPQLLREQVAGEVSSVATKSLEDDKVIWRASELSKDIVNGILADEQTKLAAIGFVTDIIGSEETSQAARNSLIRIINDPFFINLVHNKLKEILLNMLLNDDTKEVIVNQIKVLLQDEIVKQSLQSLILDVCETDVVKNILANFFKDVLATNTVKLQGAVLAQEVTKRVLSDSQIQEKAGEAMWSAVKHSVTPKMWSSKVKLDGSGDKDVED